MNLSDEQQVIANLEVLKYSDVWEYCETYNDKHHDLDLFERLDRTDRIGVIPDLYSSVIVLGCGDGSLVRHLDYLEYKTMGIDIFAHPFWSRQFERTGDKNKGFTHRMFQQQALWDDLPRMRVDSMWDSFVCADVLEHIPEILIDKVLKNISDHCYSGIFQIANMESKFGDHDLHLIKEDVAWWLDKIQSVMGGVVVQVDDPGAPRSRFVISWGIVLYAT